MKKLLFLALLTLSASFVSCTADEPNELMAEEPTGLIGNQFDVVITHEPTYLTFVPAIVLDGVPTLSTPHWHASQFSDKPNSKAALINKNTTIQLDIEDNVDASDWSFRVTVYQHQEFITVDQPRVIYILTGDVPLEVDDRIDFTVGESGEISSFRIRHYNGAQTVIKDITLPTIKL